MSTLHATKRSHGTHPLLLRYLDQLATRPLRTKAITTAALCFLQEVLGSNLAGMPVKRPSKDAPWPLHVLARSHVDVKALKMALYGFLISAPIGHVLIGTLQKAFAGKTGMRAKIAQLLASNLLVAPIQTAAYLASLAVINGAKSADEVVKTVKAGFFSVIRITWIVSPLSTVIAQRLIPMELWVPFFNLIQFLVGTFFNTRVKQLRLAAANKEKPQREKREQDAERQE